LWAGQAALLAKVLPSEQIVDAFAREARAALESARRALGDATERPLDGERLPR